jgi:predicted nucleic acid-binding protein
MEIVVDANILLAVILNEPEKRKIINLTKDTELVVPEIMPYEIGNALSNLLKRRKLNQEQALSVYNTYQFIPLRLVKPDLGKALKLAAKYNIYAYDAYYLEIASRLKTPLLSLDKQMQNIGADLKIEIWEV